MTAGIQPAQGGAQQPLHATQGAQGSQGVKKHHGHHHKKVNNDQQQPQNPQISKGASSPDATAGLLDLVA